VRVLSKGCDDVASDRRAAVLKPIEAGLESLIAALVVDAMLQRREKGLKGDNCQEGRERSKYGESSRALQPGKKY
jgi:hypothetical protein